MRADFQKQIVECGKVNDKDAGRAQRSVHKLHITAAHIQTAHWAVHKTFRPLFCLCTKGVHELPISSRIDGAFNFITHQVFTRDRHAERQCMVSCALLGIEAQAKTKQGFSVNSVDKASKTLTSCMTSNYHTKLISNI